MEGNQPQEGVKQEAPVNTPAPEAKVEAQANPPAESNSAPVENKPNNQVPYPRFKEVIDLKNQYEGRVKELEARLASVETKAQSFNQPQVDEDVADLVRNGLTEQDAKLLVGRMRNIADRMAEEKIAPIQKQYAQQEMLEWEDRFKEKHKDFEELQPKMLETYMNLKPEVQSMIVSDPSMLEFLYSHAKAKALEEQLEKQYEKGKQEAYTNQGLKKSMSSSSGTAPKSESLPSDPVELNNLIAEKGYNWYLENRANILKMLSNK